MEDSTGLQHALIDWFAANARELPWRGAPGEIDVPERHARQVTPPSWRSSAAITTSAPPDPQRTHSSSWGRRCAAPFRARSDVKRMRPSVP